LPNSKLLLLVEDEPLIMLLIQEMLEESGYLVLVATHGQAAMDILDGRIGELAGLITDVRLGPGADGWAIARRARELDPDFPVVYATGDSAADWPAQGVPGSIVIQKPYASNQILCAIASLVREGSRQAAALSETIIRWDRG
jgi:CheY-like chemotaxis protein